MSRRLPNKVKRTKADIVFNIIAYTIFTLLIVIFAYPFYYLLINTISDNELVNLNKVVLHPIGVHFNNYVNVLKLDRLWDAAVISVARTLIGTFSALLFTAYAGYIFSKTEMWGRTFWYRLAVTTMYISAGMIPIYLNVKNLGLMNNFWVYIVLHLFSAYNMILVKTYIESLPPSLEESAEIDGAGYLTRFFRIVLPLSKPILATIGLFSAVGHWNNMFDTKMYITKQKLYTLQFVLYEYYEHVKSIQETMVEGGMDASLMKELASATTTRLTMTAVTVIPIMCLYPFIQKYYMKGIMIGAVKG